jgi:glutathione S-transferase|tara:strand:+ start:4015 stop:4707 length:693 start_codon:yes stop_codon:yes gene_type:complete
MLTRFQRSQNSLDFLSTLKMSPTHFCNRLHARASTPPTVTMGLLTAVAKLTAQSMGVLAVESYGSAHLAKVAPELHGAVWGIAEKSGVLPKAYGLVIMVNLIVCSFAVIALSFKVGAARETFGMPLPAMYATGKDAKSVKFNCIQRGHQQALETFTMFLCGSLIGGVKYPISVAFFGLVWCKARFSWAEGYATGEPKKRYQSGWGMLIWTTLIGVFSAAGGVGLELVGVM